MMIQVKKTPNLVPNPILLCQLSKANRARITAAMVIATFVAIEAIGHPDVPIATKLLNFCNVCCDPNDI